MLLLLLACGQAPVTDSGGESGGADFVDVAWSAQRAPLATVTAGGRAWKRGIIHLHSHYSHDACDGEPMVDGVPREDCLADFRAGLCANAMDFAFVTDHPAHAAEQPYEDLLLRRDQDETVGGVANRMHCDAGNGTDQRVLLMPGIEDEVMPIGLRRQATDDAAENDRIYNGSDAETFTAEMNAGALVMQAHTEQQPLELLSERQALGLTGVEMFNLHAMFDPDIREEALGLDGFGYLDEIGPFISATTDAQPDLAFLGVYQPQDVSIGRWDALNRARLTVGTAGTDAHENVLPSLASDGERFDSYRRMEAWFSNVALVDDAAGDGYDADDYQAAVRDAHLFIAFEILGTPDDWDVHYGPAEMGGEGAVGDDFVVTCPALAATTPQQDAAPEISVQVLKDGEVWQEACGEWPVTEPGVYRAVATITPHHLTAFLGDQGGAMMHPYPWLYSNAFRIGLD